MKKFLLLPFIALSATAQIKIYNTNQISLGYVLSGSSTPLTGIQTHAVGNTLFTANSAGTTGALIKGTNGFSPDYAPEYTWNGDHQTGIFHKANGNIGFAISGTEFLNMAQNRQIFLACAPTASPWEDGKLNIGTNNATNEPAIAINVNHAADWGRVVNVYASQANTIGYRCALKNTVYGWYVTASGATFGYANYLLSDRTLKDDIKPLESPIEIVKKLNGVSYKFKSEKENSKLFGEAKIQYGFIAQEVEKVFPGSSVVKEIEGNIKAVNYTEIIPFLVEAIKEQQNQIEKLQSDLKNTKAISSTSISGQGINAILFQNIPNPFNEKTEIKYSIPEMSKESVLYVYNMNGLQIMSFPIKEKGNGSIMIEGSKLEPGMYLYSLIVDNQEVETKRMILTK